MVPVLPFFFAAAGGGRGAMDPVTGPGRSGLAAPRAGGAGAAAGGGATAAATVVVVAVPGVPAGATAGGPGAGIHWATLAPSGFIKPQD